MRYRRTRRDANHAEIVAALKAAGCSVVDLAAVGGGVCDLLVGYEGANYLLEVKNLARKGGAENAAGTFAKQAKFRREWRGQATVVNDAAGAVRYVTAGARDLAGQPLNDEVAA